ncbi:MAG: hypothetical protein RL015_974, partial [Verrucomicrobiota bacterium]
EQKCLSDGERKAVHGLAGAENLVFDLV